MPFASAASLINDDGNNMLRGLHRNNADFALTGSTTESNIFTLSITGGTIGATGGFHLIATGTLTGVAGTKTIRLKFGGTTMSTITQTAGTTSDWFFDAWCFNTATGTQRWFVQRNGNDLLTSTFDYTTSAIDTTASQNLLITGQLGNAGDTITFTFFNAFVAQIT